MSESFVLDTHPLVWWLLQPKRLSKRVAKLFEQPTSQFYVPSMALLEMKYLIEIGRVEAKVADAVAYIQATSQFSILPYDEAIMVESFDIETRDPFDRVIVSTALAFNQRLITKDSWITDTYPKLAIW